MLIILPSNFLIRLLSSPSMTVEEFQRWYVRAEKIEEARKQRINTQDDNVFRRNDDLVRLVRRAYNLPVPRGQKAEISTRENDIYMSFVDGEFEVEVFARPSEAVVWYRHYKAEKRVERRFKRQSA